MAFSTLPIKFAYCRENGSVSIDQFLQKIRRTGFAKWQGDLQIPQKINRLENEEFKGVNKIWGKLTRIR
jgi:hypothetical protein